MLVQILNDAFVLYVRTDINFASMSVLYVLYVDILVCNLPLMLHVNFKGTVSNLEFLFVLGLRKLF
jgi:hypothetical protein